MIREIVGRWTSLTALRTALLLGLVAAGASACATTHAEAPRERPGPPLDVPIPPPRVIAPLPVPEPPPIPPVNNIPSAPPATKPRPQRPAESTTAKPEQKSEEKQAETPPPANPAPVPQLSIPEADPSKLAAETRASIDRTRAALEKVDYGRLSEPGQKNYNDAKLFATQAEAALKANNFLEAKELADKAERLAKAIQGR